MSEQLSDFCRAFAAAGAALRAARESPDGWHVEDGHLVITDRMLADKTLRQIEAGGKLPERITLDFPETSKLFCYLATITGHFDPRYPLVADHPLFSDAAE